MSYQHTMPPLQAGVSPVFADWVSRELVKISAELNASAIVPTPAVSNGAIHPPPQNGTMVLVVEGSPLITEGLFPAAGTYVYRDLAWRAVEV